MTQTVCDVGSATGQLSITLALAGPASAAIADK